MRTSRPLWFFILILSILDGRGINYPPTFRAVKAVDSEIAVLPTQAEADAFGNTFWAGAYAGNLASFGTMTVANNAEAWKFDGFICKLGPNFEESWVKGGGGPGDQGVTGLAVDGTGNLLFAMIAWESDLTFDGISFTSPSNSMMVVFKYSGDGERIWARKIDGIQTHGWSKSVALDGNGNVIVVGTFEDNRAFISKLNSSGDQIWSRTGSVVAPEFSMAVQTDLDANIIFVTSFTDPTAYFSSTVITNNGLKNFALVKYSPGGDVLWARNGGGSSSASDLGVDITVDENRNTYLLSRIGSTNAIFGDLYFQQNSESWFLTRYDPLGQAQWAQPFYIPFGGTSVGGARVERNGNILLSVNAEPFPEDSISAGFLAECTPQGEVLWTKRVRIREDDPDSNPGSLFWTTRLISDNENNLYVAGNNNAGFGPSFLGLDSLSLATRSFISKLSFDPLLSSVITGNRLTLSWPTNEVGFVLETAASLETSASWEPVTNSVALISGRNEVSDIAAGSARFYRLRKTIP